jgi:quercetin dioxygenase-like cupin family protein
MVMHRSPVFLPPEAPRTDLNVVGESIRVLADASQTGSYEVFEQFGPEGAGPPPHTHAWDEAYFMIEGEMDVQIGDRVVVLKQGGFVHLPSGTPHCFRYRSKNGRFLSVTSRGGAAAFFTDLAKTLPDGSPDIPKVVAVAARHGVLLAGPPPA